MITGLKGQWKVVSFAVATVTNDTMSAPALQVGHCNRKGLVD